MNTFTNPSQPIFFASNPRPVPQSNGANGYYFAPAPAWARPHTYPLSQYAAPREDAWDDEYSLEGFAPEPNLPPAYDPYDESNMGSSFEETPTYHSECTAMNPAPARYVSPKDLHPTFGSYSQPQPNQHVPMEFGVRYQQAPIPAPVPIPQFGASPTEDDVSVSVETPMQSPRFAAGSSFGSSPSFEIEAEDEDSDEMEISRVSRAVDDDEEDDIPLSWNGGPPINVTLPPSKTPCLDALAFCVVMKLGADITDEDKEHHSITIFDCDTLLGYIKHFCPKQNQTSNNEARIKALKRWFNNIPAKKRRSDVFKIEMKPDKRQAIRRIIKKLEQFAQKEGLVQTPSFGF